MRHLVVVFVTTFIALGLVSQAGAQTEEPAFEANRVRGKDQILGSPIYSKARVERYARSVKCTRYIKKTIPIYYKMAPRRNIAPDVLIAQAILETGRGHYTGDSKPWNMAGIKKGDATGDDRKDFEVPKTARAGVRMHINHMAAYTGKKPIGEPHDRFYVARAAQKDRGWWVRKVSHLGNGIWATDPDYSEKIHRILNGMGKR